MNKSELHQLFKTNPLLAIQVASFGEEKLGQIEVLTSSNMPQKYQEFCQKLQLGDPPALVVCPAEFHGKLHGKQRFIFYTMFTNSVWMPRSVLEKLTNNDPKAKYVTAHELGHASGRMNRRNFLKSFGAATAGGLMAGTATTALLNEATKDPDTIQKLGGAELWRNRTRACYLAGACKTHGW